MEKLLQRWLATLFFSLLIVFSFNVPAFAINQTLVPCQESQAFQALQKKSPNTYYFNKPMQAYSSNLLCGADDGLPHLALDRLNNVVDAIIPFSIFFYVAGLIGWSGRAYLQKSNKAKNPEE
jgi:photosystem I subunit 3